MKRASNVVSIAKPFRFYLVRRRRSEAAPIPALPRERGRE